MKKAVVLGHFAFGEQKTNGQTIKTKVIANELQRVFGKEEVGLEDTSGRWRFILRLPVVSFKVMRNYQNVIFLPAYKGVRIVIPLLVFLNFFFHRRLHYVVIGGWLPDYAKKYPLLRRSLRKLHGIYVETQQMKEELATFSFSNIVVMPNCKSLPIADSQHLSRCSTPPFHLCTFSRVRKTKGIEEAIEAVNDCNRQSGRELFHLDIYGPVEEKEWFDRLMSNQPKEIRYCGIIPYDSCTDVLGNYFAMLFPTYYPGEGFAGTIIDAFSAGIPVLASDWRSNKEFVEDGITGFLFGAHSTQALIEKLNEIARQPQTIDNMRPSCVKKAAAYQPSVVLQILIQRMK